MEDLKEKYLKDGNIVVLRNDEEYVIFHDTLTNENSRVAYCDDFDDDLDLGYGYDIMIIKDFAGNVLWERPTVYEIVLNKYRTFALLADLLRVPMNKIVLDLELSKDTSITIKY